MWLLLITLMIVQTPVIRAQTQHTTDQVLPKGSADLLVPILDLRYESIRECGIGKEFRCTSGPAGDRDTARWKKVEELVAGLIKNKSSSADEAVVVLLQYYVGESEGPDLITNVTTRGRRVLPYLLKYRDNIPSIPGRSYPASMLTDQDIRQEEFDEAIRAVKSGKILTVD